MEFKKIIDRLALTVAVLGVFALFAIVTSADEGGSFTVTVGVRGTEVDFNGTTMPNALVTFSEGGTVIGSTVSNDIGEFSYTYPYANYGDHTYDVQAQDSASRDTKPVSFDVTIDSNETVEISDIFLPPTIELLSQDVLPGDEVTAVGEAQPGATLTLAIDGTDIVHQTVVNSTGHWTIIFPVTFESGGYNVYAIANTLTGLLSEKSNNALLIVVGDFTPTPTPTIAPTITPTPTPGGCCSKRSDLNCDGKVSLPDFSILMFYWKKDNACADANHDGIVSLPDFSIMMFDWGK